MQSSEHSSQHHSVTSQARTFFHHVSKHPSRFMPIVVMVALVSSVVMGVLTLAGTKNYDLRSQAAYPLYQACVVNSDCQSNVCRTCRAGEVCPDVIGKFCFSPDPTRIVSTVTPTCVTSGNQQGTGQCCSGVSSVTDKAGVRWCGVAPEPTKVPELQKTVLGVNEPCDLSNIETTCPPGTACMGDQNDKPGNYQTKCITLSGTEESRNCPYTDVNGHARSLQVNAFSTASDGKCYTCILGQVLRKESDLACTEPSDTQVDCYERNVPISIEGVACCYGLKRVTRPDGPAVCDFDGVADFCYRAGLEKKRTDIPCCDPTNVVQVLGKPYCGPLGGESCSLRRPDQSHYYVSHQACYGPQRCINGVMNDDSTCSSQKACYSGQLCNQTYYVRGDETCPTNSFETYDTCKSEGAKTGSPKVQSTTSSLNTETTKVAANVSQKYGITVDVSQNKTMLPDTVKTLDTTLDKLPQSFVVQAKNITFVDGQQKSSSNDLKGNIVVSCDPTKALECQENVVHLIAIGSTEKPVVTSTCKDGCSALDAFHKVITANKLLSVNSQGVIDPTSSKLQLPSKLAPTEKEAFAYFQAKAILDPKALSSESGELAKLFAEMGK